jgi:hypothetical protein
VTLDVRDDGIGFDAAITRENGHDGGFGLTAMRQRVTRLAGTLEVESEPGTGTAISASVPAIPAEPAPVSGPKARAAGRTEERGTSDRESPRPECAEAERETQ